MKLRILAIALVSISGFASAQELGASQSSSLDTALAEHSAAAASPVLNLPLFPARRDGLEFVLPTDHTQAASSQLIPLNSDCYTMRVYRVKGTERVKDGENTSRGYSTCEPGLRFQVRTAVASDHSQANHSQAK